MYLCTIDLSVVLNIVMEPTVLEMETSGKSRQSANYTFSIIKIVELLVNLGHAVHTLITMLTHRSVYFLYYVVFFILCCINEISFQYAVYVDKQT